MKLHRIVVPALAFLLAAAAFAPAQDQLKPEQDTLNKIFKRLDDMDRGLSDSFKALRDDITQLKMDALKGQVTAEKVARLEDEVKRLRTEIEELRKQSAGRPSFGVDPNKQTVADLEVIRSRLLADIERMIRDQQPRVAYSAPTPARLMLVNNYPEALDFVVNGVGYAVEPGATRQVDNVAPGLLNYSVVSRVWGERGRQSRNLAAGETFVITAR
jgi:hypothetical protein